MRRRSESITSTPPPPFIADRWNKLRRSDVMWASAPPRILGTDRPRPLQGRQWGTLAAGGGGGVNAAGVEERLDGTGSLRISPAAGDPLIAIGAVVAILIALSGSCRGSSAAG